MPGLAYEIAMGADYLLTVSLILFLLVPVQLTVLSWFTRSHNTGSSGKRHFLSCIITSYGSPVMCRLLIDSLLKNAYQPFEIIAVLDGTEEPFSYEHPDVTLIRPEQALNSKLRSIKRACDKTNPASEGIVIFDPDNLAHPDLLEELNGKLDQYRIIQGRRKAKNLGSPLSRAEALSEAFFNKTDRQLPFQLGSSATLAGSGMCIDRLLMTEFLNAWLDSNHQVILGEDKLMQNFFVQKGLQIAYEENAVIYDEKVSHAKQHRRQRARWLNAYFENIRETGKTLFSGLFSASWNMIVFGIVALRPPMFINFTLLCILTVLNIFLAPILAYVTLASLIIFTLYFLVKVWQLGMFTCLKDLPAFVYGQFMALVSIRKYKEEFGKTRATAYLSIDEVLNNDLLP